MNLLILISTLLVWMLVGGVFLYFRRRVVRDTSGK